MGTYAAPATTTYAAPAVTYAAPRYAAPVSTTLAAPAVTYAAAATPVAAANVGGVTVVGEDKNLDGIPDALETPVVAAAPAVTYNAAPATTLAAPITYATPATT